MNKNIFSLFFAVDHRVVLNIEALDFIPQNQNHTWKLQTEDCESDFIEFIVSESKKSESESLKLCLGPVHLIRPPF